MSGLGLSGQQPSFAADDRPLSVVIGNLLSQTKCFTDIHIETDSPIMLRTSAGEWVAPVDAQKRPIIASGPRILAFIASIYTGREEVRPPQAKTQPWEEEFHTMGSLHPATMVYSYPEREGEEIQGYRVRCTIQRQSMGGAIGLVIRALHDVPASIEELGLPVQVNRMVTNSSSGLIVVTGPTGSGKSTTLAAMIDEVNRTRANNILTIEDPIEFVFNRKMSIINQRELYVDVPSFEAGVRDALRFVPDVILVGEVRDEATMRAVLRAAESGHLVLTSMHAPTSVAALRKMLSYLDSSADSQALAACLIGVVAQGLVQCISGQRAESERSNCLAYEVLNCRESGVIQAISTFTRGTGDQMTKLEDRLRSSQIEGSTPMIASLRSLVSKGLVDPRKAAVLAHNADDRAEFLRAGAAR